MAHESWTDTRDVIAAIVQKLFVEAGGVPFKRSLFETSRFERLAEQLGVDTGAVLEEVEKQYAFQTRSQ